MSDPPLGSKRRRLPTLDLTVHQVEGDEDALLDALAEYLVAAWEERQEDAASSASQAGEAA